MLSLLLRGGIILLISRAWEDVKTKVVNTRVLLDVRKRNLPSDIWAYRGANVNNTDSTNRYQTVLEFKKKWMINEYKTLIYLISILLYIFFSNSVVSNSWYFGQNINKTYMYPVYTMPYTLIVYIFTKGACDINRWPLSFLIKQSCCKNYLLK